MLIHYAAIVVAEYEFHTDWQNHEDGILLTICDFETNYVINGWDHILGNCDIPVILSHKIIFFWNPCFDVTTHVSGVITFRQKI